LFNLSFNSQTVGSLCKAYCAQCTLWPCCTTWMWNKAQYLCIKCYHPL